MRILGLGPGAKRFWSIQNSLSWTDGPFLIQMAPVLDFVYGYQLAGHVIWHGHFLISWSPSKVPLKMCFR